MYKSKKSENFCPVPGNSYKYTRATDNVWDTYSTSAISLSTSRMYIFNVQGKTSATLSGFAATKGRYYLMADGAISSQGNNSGTVSLSGIDYLILHVLTTGLTVTIS